MRKPWIAYSMLGFAGGTLVGLGTIPAAGAATLPDTLGGAIAYAQGQISARVATLNLLANRVADSTAIDASDRSALDSIIGNTSSGDIAGLEALSAKVGAETTLAAVRSDLHEVYATYRIYAVVRPQVDLVLAGDSEVRIVADLSSLEAPLQTLIDQSGAPQAAVAAYQRYVSDIGAATTAIGTIPAQALAVTPGSFNADPSATPAVLQSDWHSLGVARSDLIDARTQIAAIIKVLG